MRKLYFLVFMLIANLAFAQTGKISVSGKVTDPADGGSLPGVSIVEKGTTLHILVNNVFAV